ncbi:hypothetical protein JR064_21375 [Xanthomonas sp. CFBP 8703]|uniref:Uncharacterized protein n=1 Tax=Xanthomonas bonasiae TaxID=2810351 RepID=A0ABS3B8P7_9XANT|nr:MULTISPECIES: hypothetical protein [Xanthomonas]MBD7923529.1 hypothetical protein [Xanthomonas surreyensis]MBN6104718.1 hypothetical protein [Xanthomonas bonasiae]MBN6113789.1 hypothetical protein [Xanthomonas bonasiae]
MKSTRAVSSFRSPHAVTVAVPVEVGNDIEKMHKITREILGRLGCAACHSGFDLRFVIERDFRVNPALEIEGFAPRIGP